MSFRRRIEREKKRRDNEVVPLKQQHNDFNLHVYGFCTWHDRIEKAGSTGPQKLVINGREINSPGLPCCPFCGSMLMQVDEEEWWDGATEYDKENPGYLNLLVWGQGKCFKNQEELVVAYNSRSVN